MYKITKNYWKKPQNNSFLRYVEKHQRCNKQPKKKDDQGEEVGLWMANLKNLD